MDRPHRIALVDPDTGLWRILANALTDLQVSLDTYSSAERFLTAIRAYTPGCVVAEMDLPDGSGLDLIREMRRLQISVPTIILSSGSELSGAVSAMRAGAIDYLQKPFVHNKLRDRISRIIPLAPA